MPISKKPRTKTAPKASTRGQAAAALPDRRAMESFLATISGRRRNDAIAKAQDVMYDAWERTNPATRPRLRLLTQRPPSRAWLAKVETDQGDQ